MLYNCFPSVEWAPLLGQCDYWSGQWGDLCPAGFSQYPVQVYSKVQRGQSSVLPFLQAVGCLTLKPFHTQSILDWIPKDDFTTSSLIPQFSQKWRNWSYLLKKMIDYSVHDASNVFVAKAEPSALMFKFGLLSVYWKSLKICWVSFRILHGQCLYLQKPHIGNKKFYQFSSSWRLRWKNLTRTMLSFNH